WGGVFCVRVRRAFAGAAAAQERCEQMLRRRQNPQGLGLQIRMEFSLGEDQLRSSCFLVCLRSIQLSRPLTRYAFLARVFCGQASALGLGRSAGGRARASAVENRSGPEASGRALMKSTVSAKTKEMEIVPAHDRAVTITLE